MQTSFIFKKQENLSVFTYKLS